LVINDKQKEKGILSSSLLRKIIKDLITIETKKGNP